MAKRKTTKKKTAKKRLGKKKATKSKAPKKKTVKKNKSSKPRVSMDKCVRCKKTTREKSYWGRTMQMRHRAKTLYERVQANGKRTWRPRVTLCGDCNVLYDQLGTNRPVGPSL